MNYIKKSLKKAKIKRSDLKKKFDKSQFLKEYDLENLSQLDIENLLNKELNKEQLLLIAEIRYGMPRGSNLKRTKEQLLEMIKNTINYNESLEVIKQKASE